MISWLVAEVGISGPRIWPDAPTEAAAKTADAARAPWRNRRREMRGLLAGGTGSGGCEAAGCVEGGGVEFVDALGFFSSMTFPPVLKNNFRSVRLHAIKDLSISYASNEMANGLRKQYNYANSEHAELRLVNGEPSEPSHSNPHIIPRIGDYDAGCLRGTMDYHSAAGTSVRPLLWLGQILQWNLL